MPPFVYGRALLGGAVSQIGQRIQFIQNVYGYSWVYVENRHAIPVTVHSVPRQSQSLNGQGIPVPPLTLACVPIDPQNDFAIALRDVAGSVAIQGVQQLTNMAVPVPLNVPARNVLWTIAPQGAPMYEPLYEPLHRCNHVSRAASLNASGVTVHATAPGGTIQIVQKNSPLMFDGDLAIVAMRVKMTSVGAAVTPDQLTVQPISAILSGVDGSDVQLYNATAAATVPANLTPEIIPLRGVQAVQIFNTGAAVVGFVAEYWVGVPYDAPPYATTI